MSGESAVIEIDEVVATIEVDDVAAVVLVSEVAVVVDQDIVESVIEPSVIEAVIDESPVHVIVVGQQGPQGPPGDSAAAAGFDATNKSGGTLAVGAVVATHSSGIGVTLANATNDQKPAVGLNTEEAVSLASATIQTSGPFELADWTAVTGTALLTGGARYYLSTVDGMLTTTSPASSPNVSQLFSKALSPNIMLLGIYQFVKL